MKTHELKTWPEYYAAIEKGEKTFEIRKNDRDFKKGDEVVLKEWNPITENYTGNSMTFCVGHVITDTRWGLQEGYCVMSILIPYFNFQP
jgi:hypothetical protein